MNAQDLDGRVKEANRKFYDAISDIYEKADGRRTKMLNQWLSDRLKKLSSGTSGKILLDIGCGTGFVLKNGADFFSHSLGIDISPEILKKVERGQGVCADCCLLPLKDSSVDMVTCFAVLHHICDYSPLLQEISRVLKKGGVFYADHDIDKTFVKKFYPLVYLYRLIFNPEKRYERLARGATRELYRLSEIHSGGIDSIGIADKLRVLGFVQVKVSYHWFGLNGFLNRVVKDREFGRGFAPLACITGRK